jgi:acetyltransferase-like isoleucine patch superfamily enzyme
MAFTKEQVDEFRAKGLYLIGGNAKIEGTVDVEDPVFLHDCVIAGPVSIGFQSYVGDFTHVAQNTVMGRYCSIGNSCTIGATAHPLQWLSTHPFQFLGLMGADVKILPWSWATTQIGNDVWIGSNSVVRGGVSIGDGAVIGAGAVVTKDVPPYAICVGNPARVLRLRFDQSVVDELLELKWWELHPSLIQSMQFDDLAKCLGYLRGIRRKLTALGSGSIFVTHK